MALCIESIRELMERISQVERDLVLVKEQAEALALEVVETAPLDRSVVGSSVPIKPRSEEVLSALERAAELADRLRETPEEDRRDRFFENMERIRAQAIEKGIAIENEREVAR